MLDKFDILYKSTVQEATKRSCWKTHEKRGTKTITKNGKKKVVNNCVKKESKAACADW